MDLRQLEYFVAVAEEGSFTRGAERLGSVQSAASAAIARLEHEAGQPLFVRGGRQLQVTEAGRLLLARARVIQEQARDARAELSALRGGVIGTVTIGTILAFGSTVLPRALQGFHRRFPQVKIRLRLSAGPVDTHLAKLPDVFDLALVPMTDDVPPDVRMHGVERVQLGLACAPGHRLARTPDVAYRDLVEETFVDFPADWGNRALIDQLFAADGCSREVAIEVTNVSAALTLVAGGLGLSFVPEQYIASQADVVAVDLRHPPPAVSLGAAIHVDSPAAVQALFGLLVQQSAFV